MKSSFVPSVLALLAAWVGVQSCTTDNPPAYQGILGPTRQPTETPSTGGSAGSGGGPTGGSSTTGGTGPSTGGTSPGGEGGMAGQGEGGEGATGGTSGGKGGKGGTAGTGTVNPPEDPNYSPACFRGPTAAGDEILKGVACTAADPHLCWRSCGPNQVGWKTETCTAGVYAEGDCVFPPEKDYSCYKIPDVIDETACGVDAPPVATGECAAVACMTCNFEGFYQDTSGDSKEGFCVCREPGADGVRRWTCASSTAWPCPLNQGC